MGRESRLQVAPSGGREEVTRLVWAPLPGNPGLQQLLTSILLLPASVGLCEG